MEIRSEYERRIIAYKGGVEAQKSGKRREDNDEPRGTIFHDDWNDGYEEAERGEA